MLQADFDVTGFTFDFAPTGPFPGPSVTLTVTQALDGEPAGAHAVRRRQ